MLVYQRVIFCFSPDTDKVLTALIALGSVAQAKVSLVRFFSGSTCLVGERAIESFLPKTKGCGIDLDESERFTKTLEEIKEIWEEFPYQTIYIILGDFGRAVWLL